MPETKKRSLGFAFWGGDRDLSPDIRFRMAEVTFCVNISLKASQKADFVKFYSNPCKQVSVFWQVVYIA